MKKLIHSFTARKILELLLTLLIVTFLSFLLVKLSPVDAAEAYARRTFMFHDADDLIGIEAMWNIRQFVNSLYCLITTPTFYKIAGSIYAGKPILYRLLFGRRYEIDILIFAYDFLGKTWSYVKI